MTNTNEVIKIEASPIYNASGSGNIPCGYIIIKTVKRHLRFKEEKK
jgi:hypothetical protein